MSKVGEIFLKIALGLLLVAILMPFMILSLRLISYFITPVYGSSNSDNHYGGFIPNAPDYVVNGAENESIKQNTMSLLLNSNDSLSDIFKDFPTYFSLTNNGMVEYWNEALLTKASLGALDFGIKLNSITLDSITGFAMSIFDKITSYDPKQYFISLQVLQ